MELTGASCLLIPAAIGGVISLLFALWRRRQHERKLNHWQVVYGTVTDISAPSPAEADEAQPPHMVISYEYEIGGKTFQNQEGSLMALAQRDRYEIGDTVKVHVPPTDHSEATLDLLEGRPTVLPALVGIGLLLLAAVGSGLRWLDEFASAEWWTLAFGFLILPATSLFLLLRGRRELKLAQESNSWPTTDGEVVFSRTVRQESGGESSSVTYRPNVTFDYEIRGQAHRSNRITSSEFQFLPTARRAREKAEEYPVGSTVTVYYKPDDPALGVLEPGDSSGGAVMVGVGILFLGFDVLFLILNL